MNPLSVLIRLFDRVAFVCLAVLATAIILQLALRNLFDYGHPGMEEVARCAHVTLVFLIIPRIYRAGGHIRIDMLVNALPAPVIRALDGFAALATIVFCAVFLYGDYLFMIRNGNVASPSLEIPNTVFFAGAYVGMTLLLLVAVERLVDVARGVKREGVA